jgi:uncharacterized protein (DUF169 family)
MKPLKTDLSIFEKFNFKNPPVGVKFLYIKPEGIEKLDKIMPVCEMIKEAQQRGTPFYITKENENCAGKSALGMLDEPAPSFAGSGEIGVKFGIFEDARANRKIYQQQPKMASGIKYVVFSPLDKLTFEPDLLFLMASVSQAETVMRAMSYSTGEIYSSNMSGVGACSWLFVYPFISGKVNYVVTGMGFGMKSRQVFPEGWMLIVIPYNWLPIITQNLKEMEWVLPAYMDGREKFMERDKRIKAELFKEAQNS